MHSDLDPKNPWRVLRILGEFVEGFDELSDIAPAVSVFGGSRSEPDSEHYDLARRVARQLGGAGFNIITGGGPGIMEAANRGAQEAGVCSVGLNIEIPQEQDVNPYVDHAVSFRFFFARKVMFLKHACGVVILPGGFGTMDELFESLTLIQTGKMDPVPVVLCGSEYWGGLVEWMQAHSLGRGYIDGVDLELFHMVDEPEEVVEAVLSHPRNARYRANPAPEPRRISAR